MKYTYEAVRIQKAIISIEIPDNDYESVAEEIMLHVVDTDDPNIEWKDDFEWRLMQMPDLLTMRKR